MISRENVVSIMKAVAKGTWNSLPTILTLIPATAVAGKVLCEVKKIADDFYGTDIDYNEIKSKLPDPDEAENAVNDAQGALNGVPVDGESPSTIE